MSDGGLATYLQVNVPITTLRPIDPSHQTDGLLRFRKYSPHRVVDYINLFLLGYNTDPYEDAWVNSFGYCNANWHKGTFGLEGNWIGQCQCRPHPLDPDKTVIIVLPYRQDLGFTGGPDMVQNDRMSVFVLAYPRDPGGGGDYEATEEWLPPDEEGCSSGSGGGGTDDDLDGNLVIRVAILTPIRPMTSYTSITRASSGRTDPSIGSACRYDATPTHRAPQTSPKRREEIHELCPRLVL